VCVRCVLVRVYVCVRICVRARRVCALTWCVYAHVKGLKAPSSWCASFPREGQPPELFVPLGGLEGRLGRLSQPVPIHA